MGSEMRRVSTLVKKKASMTRRIGNEEPTKMYIQVPSIVREKTFIDDIRKGGKSRVELASVLPDSFVLQCIKKYTKLELIYCRNGRYFWYTVNERVKTPNFIEHAKEIANNTYQLGAVKQNGSTESFAIEKAIVEHIKSGYDDIYKTYLNCMEKKKLLVSNFKNKDNNGSEINPDAKLGELREMVSREDEMFQAFTKINEELTIKLSELRAIIKYDPSKLKGECFICRED